MNRELKRISVLVVLMFTALFVASSVIQVFQADALNQDARNTRAVEETYRTQRGQILTADGKAIVTSKPVDDRYRFQREYAQPELYASVTGYFPIGGEPTGIEGALNTQLAGTASSQFFDRLQRTLSGQDPQGDSVQLTIDPVVQQAAWDALDDQRGAVVALEPSTGRVLALVSKPSFDPNELASHDLAAVNSRYEELLGATPSPLVNRAIAGDLNPPGSTFKVVMAAAALETGDYSADSAQPNPAELTLPGTSFVVENSNGSTCGGGDEASIATALKLSCNIPFAELGIELGSETIADRAEAFGFNQALSIPVRVTPSVYKRTDERAQVAQSAFGQWEDRATPMQMAMVSSAIANDGVLMKPNLVQKVLGPDLGTVDEPAPAELSRPVSAATADEVTKMMVSSVADGAGTNARIEGVDVAGKTGTAQNGADDPYTLWFTGFAPADDPQVAVAVVIENGGGLGQDGFGNLLAAPVAKRVMEAVLDR